MTGEAPAAAMHLQDWLAEQALATASAGEAFEGLVKRLRADGLPIARAHIAHTTLHPLFAGAGATWTPDRGLVEESYEHGRSAKVAGWAVSPIRHAISERLDRFRRRLEGPGATLDFPILKEFAAEGLTDYFLMTTAFDGFFRPTSSEEDMSASLSGMAASFATDRAGGFTDGEIEVLRAILRPLAVATKMADQRQVAMNLAECYIGREAGPRVLGGAIKRGDFASTEAVVFLADLRASTEMSIALPSDEFVRTINEFFDCAVTAVEAEGGEPLTFIGDGVLAIFPVERLGAAGARVAAHRAALGTSAAIDALNAERRAAGRTPIGWGVALHAGRLEYGNIGSLARHSWSVVGKVVNETARLEGTTKETGEPIVVSRAFVDGLGEGADGWRPLGAFDLKGVPAPFEIFAPPRAPAITARAGAPAKEAV